MDNIVTYDVVLRRRTDPSFTIEGYKAINIIGMVRLARAGAAHLENPAAGDPLDARLELEDKGANGLNMFRLKQSMRTIVVHQRVKDHLQAKGFDDLIFDELDDALIL
ncbi:hypothetical protein H1235_02010 [Pseudoxanthomonas sp. NC8]|nr:hypothetical protein H1235_02010 [Pseudoxanthomonas sp. NC8]